ncbi:hypothetical protein ACIA98_22655 [Streptomyces sp. NPDC051366]|uniref:zinc finger domain-containing protein n=1 Tax=Streptomyces sp. NPDC051366 TaxID=3365652 RepID=UPI00379580B2
MHTNTSPPSRPPTQSVWHLSSTDVRSVDCPTCDAAKGQPCLSLRNRPLNVLHRGRSSRYLNLRFGLRATRPRRGGPEAAAHPLTGPALRAVPVAHNEPWRLPRNELADLITFSFLDHAKVVVAEACGVERTGLTELLYDGDRLSASIDALTYAQHDLQIRREERCLAVGRWDQETQHLDWQYAAVAQRAQEARKEFQRRRTEDLTAAGVLPGLPATDDPREQALLWLAQHLEPQFRRLLTEHAAAAGLPPEASAAVRTRHGAIERATARGLIHAPLHGDALRVHGMSEGEFRLRVLRDASTQADRDDALCHPLLLHRWRQHLKQLQTEVAPGALSPSAQSLAPLAWEELRPQSLHEVRELMGRRRLLGNLLQRYGENRRLRYAVHDAISIAEHAHPEKPLLMAAARDAREELGRRHPDLYKLIRNLLEPHLTRYGRLRLRNAQDRQQARGQVMLALLESERAAAPPRQVRC